MQPIFFVMAIMGCGDGGNACQDARLVPVEYPSMAQCRAALPDQIARNTDVPFPTIGAECRQIGQEMVARSGKLPRG